MLIYNCVTSVMVLYRNLTCFRMHTFCYDLSTANAFYSLILPHLQFSAFSNCRELRVIDNQQVLMKMSHTIEPRGRTHSFTSWLLSSSCVSSFPPISISCTQHLWTQFSHHVCTKLTNHFTGSKFSFLSLSATHPFWLEPLSTQLAFCWSWLDIWLFCPCLQLLF